MLSSGVARRLLAIGFIALCAAWYVKQNILNVLPTPGLSDFRYYYDAAARILHGESPYRIVDYVYPPLLACLLTPVAKFDYFTGRWIWFVFSQACFLAAAFLLWRRMGRNWLAAAVIAFVWSAGWAGQDAFPTGQPDPLLTLLIVVACCNSGWIQGAAAGAGFAIKLIPAVLGLLGPGERNWRGFAAFLASAGLCLAIPWAIIAPLNGPKAPVNTDYLFGTPCVLSWSIPSVALRVWETPDDDDRLPNNWVNGWDLPRLHLTSMEKLLSLSLAIAIMAAGIAVLWFKTGGKLSGEQIPFAGTALIALALAASPIAWWHYQVMQYPGVALLLYTAIRRSNWRRLGESILCALFLFPIPAGVLRYYYHQQERWPDAPVLLYIWTSVTPLASLILFGLLLSAMPSRDPSASRSDGSDVVHKERLQDLSPAS